MTNETKITSSAATIATFIDYQYGPSNILSMVTFTISSDKKVITLISHQQITEPDRSKGRALASEYIKQMQSQKVVLAATGDRFDVAQLAGDLSKHAPAVEVAPLLTSGIKDYAWKDLWYALVSDIINGGIASAIIANPPLYNVLAMAYHYACGGTGVTTELLDKCFEDTKGIDFKVLQEIGVVTNH